MKPVSFRKKALFLVTPPSSTLCTKHVPKENRTHGPETEVRTVPWDTCTIAPLLDTYELSELSDRVITLNH